MTHSDANNCSPCIGTSQKTSRFLLSAWEPSHMPCQTLCSNHSTELYPAHTLMASMIQLKNHSFGFAEAREPSLSKLHFLSASHGLHQEIR